jgi:hypothetical protein
MEETVLLDETVSAFFQHALDAQRRCQDPFRGGEGQAGGRQRFHRPEV